MKASLDINRDLNYVKLDSGEMLEFVANRTSKPVLEVERGGSETEYVVLDGDNYYYWREEKK